MDATTTLTFEADDAPPPSATPPRVSERAPARLARAAVMLGCMAAPAAAAVWSGPGPAAWTFGVCALAAWLWVLRAPVAAAEAIDATAPAGMQSPAHAQGLTAHVVPIWKRNIESALTHSERSASSLLESFSGLSGYLDKALSSADGGLQVDVGATDALLQRHRDEIDHFVAVAQQAFALQREMRAGADRFLADLNETANVVRDLQNIARATQLLAMNTSVEATRTARGAGTGSGLNAVAAEVRSLSGQCRSAADALVKQVRTLQASVKALRGRAGADDADDEEVALRTEQAARRVVQALLGSLGEVTRASQELQSAGRTVQADLEKIFVSLQSHDRTHQMLGAVTADMGRLSEWLLGGDDAHARSSVQWLARLEESYPMENMRSAHHGTVAIEQESSVEFF